MTTRFVPNQPTVQTKDLQAAEKQRVFDFMQIQNKLKILFDELASKPHLDSFLLEDIELTTGVVNYVNHKLNRNIRGWQVHKLNANAVVWEDTTIEVNNKTQIALYCSANVTISLVVY